MNIHPSAKIHPKALLGPGIVIGPNVTIEEDVVVGAYSVIGGMPEHAKFYNDPMGERTLGVKILKGARIFEFVTIHAGTSEPTIIGEGAAIHNHSHIAHDVHVGAKATVGGHATIGGHVKIMQCAVIGGRAAIHQWSVIGAYCLLSAMSFLRGFMPPGSKWIGVPARPAGNNDIGMERGGVTFSQVQSEFEGTYLKLKGDSRL